MDNTAERGLLVSSGDGPRMWVMDELITFIAGAADTGGRYALTESVVPPGGEAPPHRHTREAEAFYMLAGELDVTVGDDHYHLQAGSFVHLPSGMTHAYRNGGTEEARFLTLMAPAGLEEFFKDIGTPAADLTGPPPMEDMDLARLVEVAAAYGVFIEGD